MPDAKRWVKCQTRDLSFARARVQIDDMPDLPAAVYFLQIRDRLAYEAQIIWSKAPELGLKSTKVRRFNEVPSAPLRGLIEKMSEWILSDRQARLAGWRVPEDSRLQSVSLWGWRISPRLFCLRT